MVDSTAPQPPAPPEEDDEPLADVLAHLTFVTMAALSKAAADHDLSLTQLRLLGILRDRRATMGALAAHLGLDRSTLSGLVDRAGRRDLLAREPNAHDGRAVDVFLTTAGHDLALRLQARVRGDLAPLTARLAPAEQHRLQRLLEQVLAEESL